MSTTPSKMTAKRSAPEDNHPSKRQCVSKDSRDALNELEKKEPLLRENPGRYVLFPIKHKSVWDRYKQAEAAFWTVEEVDLSTDVTDWEKLTSDERHFVSHIFAFFAASDRSLAGRFMNDVQIPEARCFYGFQIAIENIHSEMYSMLIDTYVKDNSEKETLFRSMETFPVVAKKAEWADKWLESESTFAERLVAFAAVEGIFFSGAFCSMYSLRKRGVMPGSTFANEMISRDAVVHADFACHLYTLLEHTRLTDDRVKEILTNAVEIEKEFITEALPVKLIGMNSDLMKQYIEFVADRLFVALGHDKHYGIKSHPFPEVELLSMPSQTVFLGGGGSGGKSSFFVSHRVGPYTKVSDQDNVPREEVFSLTEDF